MGKKIFMLCFAAVCSMLLSVQGYFALHEDAVKTLRADRIGASLVSLGDRLAAAGERYNVLSTYLTVETAGQQLSTGQLLINGQFRGSFERGTLTLRVEEGDVLTVRGGKDLELLVVDYPEDLNKNELPENFLCRSDHCKWGKICFK